MKRREFLKASAAGAAFAASGGAASLLAACGGKSRALGRKVIVLAIDGMDPNLTRRFVDAGALPTFARFMEKYSFTKLGTGLPPQSPVAWADFITGAGAGVHGIFDFIHRDPKTMTPYLSTSRVLPSTKNIKVGGFVLPLAKGKVENLKRGPVLWEILGEHGVPVIQFKCPSNFPPVKCDGRTVAGMGTPDMRGTYGIFSYYTDDPPADADKFTGGECIPVRLWDNTFSAELTGPPNNFRAGEPAARLRFTVYRDPSRPLAKIVIGGHEIILKAGEWTGWYQVKFPLVGRAAAATGMIRLYLKEAHPNFRLYVSPVNIDPAAPALPLSTPAGYAGEVAARAGRYYTESFPEDTKALTHGVFTDEEYMTQADIVLDESFAALAATLAEFDDGFYYYYFSTIDQNTHMMWRPMDPNHPLYEPRASARVKGAVEHYYRAMDRAFAEVLAKVDDKTTLFVISDHGFAPFYREFNLNTWLLDNGYIALKDPARRAESEFLEDVDWARTRAYGLGLNALYVNLRGREPHGAVAPGAVATLVDELAAGLESYQDPYNGARVVVRAYKSRERYRGPEAKNAPEIIVGFAPGYRMGDDSATGEFPPEVTKQREDKWAADHCIDPNHVPGVLFCNKPVEVAGPTLRDLAPTILKVFGVAPPPEMTGRPILG